MMAEHFCTCETPVMDVEHDAGCRRCGLPVDFAPKLPTCFMGYDPAEHCDDEKFYVMRMYEMTIYGHTVDHWTKRDYPEDWPLTERGRREGREFACWHSQVCPDGEIGSNPMDAIEEITFEEFARAAGGSWPDLPDSPVTTEAPATAIGHYDEKGNIVWDWDSLRGDYEGRGK